MKDVKVGDRVRVLESIETDPDLAYEPGVEVGDTGRVVGVTKDVSPPIRVTLDRNGFMDAFWPEELELLNE